MQKKRRFFIENVRNATERRTRGVEINLHVHLHFLVTEGGVDEAGVFQEIPRIDDSRLAEIFAREVLGSLSAGSC